MKKLVLVGLASAMVLVFAGALFADQGDEQLKKVEAEIGLPVENARALDCTGAIALTCGQVYTGTTVGAVNNVATYSCVAWNEGGPEKVFTVTTTGNYTIQAALTGMTVDLDVFILSACDATTCIAYGNTTALTTCKPAGTYYIVVDGYGTASGAFTLTITCTPCSGPPANDTCAGAIDLPCNVPISISGSTATASNDYSPGAYGNACTGYTANGYDLAYKFTVPVGAVLNVSYTSSVDASFYVITDCASPSTTCVVGADDTFSGQAEVINHTFTSAGLYYLILDNYSTGGTFTLVGTLSCPTATDETTWGHVKTLYR